MTLRTDRSIVNTAAEHVSDHNALHAVTPVSPKEYGATGDGTTDDTVAIQAALDACPAGGVVALTGGLTYRTSVPLVVPPNVTLQGAHGKRITYGAAEGAGMTNPAMIKPLASFSGAAAIRFYDKEEGGYLAESVGQRLRYLTIDGSALAGGSGIQGVRATGKVREVILQDVCAQYFPHNGFATASYTRADASSVHPYSWYLLNCIARSCGNIGFSHTSFTDSSFFNCQALGCTAYGFFLNGMANTSMVSCRAEWSGSAGFYFTGSWGTGTGSGACTCTNLTTDRNANSGILVDATGNSPIVFTGLQLRRDGRNGGSGGGSYAGFRASSTTLPIVLNGVVVYPGVDDDGTATSSPQYGVSVTGSTWVAVNSGYLHAATAGWFDGGGNTSLRRGGGVGEATGMTGAPTRLVTDSSRAVRTGLAKVSAGAAQWGAPGTLYSSQGTTALVVNEDRYVPLIVPYPVTLTAWQLEVTAAPASSANLRLAVYPADTDMQPLAATAPLYDSGAVAVASGFTGIKTATGLTVAIAAGVYLVAVNTDVIMTLRSFASGTPVVLAALGATPLSQRFSVARVFAAFPTPGTKWTATSASAGGLQHFAVWQWTEI